MGRASQARAARSRHPARRAFWERIVRGQRRHAGVAGSRKRRPSPSCAGAACLAAHHARRARRRRGARGGVSDRCRPRRPGSAHAARAAAAAAGRRNSATTGWWARRCWIAHGATRSAFSSARSPASAASRSASTPLLVRPGRVQQARRAPQGRRPVRVRPRRRGDRGAAGARHSLHRGAGHHRRAAAPQRRAACRSPTAAWRKASPSSAATATRRGRLARLALLRQPAAHGRVLHGRGAAGAVSWRACAPPAPPPSIRSRSSSARHCRGSAYCAARSADIAALATSAAGRHRPRLIVGAVACGGHREHRRR